MDSEPGKGSIFYFTVPSVSEQRQIVNKTLDTTADIENNYSGKTILIAEDEVSNFEFLRIFLTKMDIRVLWARTGIEVMNMCKTEPSVDLVLMDIKMPLLNGYEATVEIKKMRPELPVIAQTAYAMKNDKTEALKAGCDNYLSKPIQIRQLKDILNKYL